MVEFGMTHIPGLRTVAPFQIGDDRGQFVKLFHEGQFAAAGRNVRHPEIYLSTSHRGVLRGMHLQVPPNDHAKLVYCLSGTVLDVIVDLRIGSPTYGQCEAFLLDGTAFAGLSIPSGCAHGFLVQSEAATLLYMVETVHAPESDTGIRWDSFEFRWPNPAPVFSARDLALPPLVEFSSPFRYVGGPA